MPVTVHTAQTVSVHRDPDEPKFSIFPMWIVKVAGVDKPLSVAAASAFQAVALVGEHLGDEWAGMTVANAEKIGAERVA